ncbi:MAG: FTR1 family protein [Alphaproteobacteria bacterium]
MYDTESWTMFVQSASILLREGLEVILILSALIAYLLKSGARQHLSSLYIGAAIGVAASFGLAMIIETFLGEEQSALLESVMLLLAAGLMIYVSGWLFVKQDPRAWQAYIHNHADQALQSKQSGFAIGVLSFFSVIREGAETVVFYHALTKAEGGWTSAIVTGFVVAAIGLAFIFIAMRLLTVRLPLRPLFVVTSAFLFVMAFRFLGDGLHELQEAHLLPESPINIPSLLYSIGFQKTLEALLPQLVLLAVAAAGFAAFQFRRAPAQP